jgi:hypothetical protein
LAVAPDSDTDEGETPWSNITFDIDDLCPKDRGKVTVHSTYPSTLNDTFRAAHSYIDRAYMSGVEHNNPSQDVDGSDSDESDWEEDDADVELVDDPRSDSHVFMAHSVGQYHSTALTTW